MLVRALVTSPDGVQLVNAKAGSGKTSVLRAARQAWQAAGYRVVGVALAARAARELQQSSGIAAGTIARLLSDLDNPSSAGLAPGTVLVIDEAGMVGTRQLARLLAHAQHAHAKVVAVGDIEQLPEIEAGGLFRSLVRRLGGAELQTNHRQREPWEQQALDLLRSGDAIAAIARYAQHDRLVVRSRAGRLRNRMVQDWWAAAQRPGERPPIMIALRHRDVAELNTAARQLLAKQGRIGGAALGVGDRDFAIGDRIITLRNARQLGVLNGTFATVTGVNHHAKSLRIHTDDGHDLVLPCWYLQRQGWLHHRRQIDHAYAVTCHKAQGMTTDRVFVLATDDIYKQWAYVAMSRGRLENRLYLAVDQHPLAEELDLPPQPSGDAVLELSVALERPRGQYLALDQLPTTIGTAGTPPSRSDTGDDPRTAPQRPPRPISCTGNVQQNLAALRALHRACSIDLLHAQEQMAAQRPGWRRRRLLSRAIASAERTLAGLDQQISQVKAIAAETTGNDHPPATSQAADPNTAGSNPPRYLIAALGGWPRTQAAQAVWRLAANQIDAYRLRAGINDPKTALGPQPDAPDRRPAYDAIARLIQDAAAAIDTLEEPTPPDPNDDLALPGPL